MNPAKRLRAACFADGSVGPGAGDERLIPQNLPPHWRRRRALPGSATRRRDRPLCSRKPARC